MKYFKKEVIRLGNKKSGASYGPNVVYAITSQQIIQQIINNPNAIGFLGMGWVSPEVKTVAIGKK